MVVWRLVVGGGGERLERRRRENGESGGMLERWDIRKGSVFD